MKIASFDRAYSPRTEERLMRSLDLSPEQTNALRYLISLGVVLSFVGNELHASPEEALTPEVLSLLREHAALCFELGQDLFGDCNTPATSLRVQ